METNKNYLIPKFYVDDQLDDVSYEFLDNKINIINKSSNVVQNVIVSLDLPDWLLIYQKFSQLQFNFTLKINFDKTNNTQISVTTSQTQRPNNRNIRNNSTSQFRLRLLASSDKIYIKIVRLLPNQTITLSQPTLTVNDDMNYSHVKDSIIPIIIIGGSDKTNMAIEKLHYEQLTTPEDKDVFDIRIILKSLERFNMSFDILEPNGIYPQSSMIIVVGDAITDDLKDIIDTITHDKIVLYPVNDVHMENSNQDVIILKKDDMDLQNDYLSYSDVYHIFTNDTKENIKNRWNRLINNVEEPIKQNTSSSEKKTIIDDVSDEPVRPVVSTPKIHSTSKKPSIKKSPHKISIRKLQTTSPSKQKSPPKRKPKPKPVSVPEPPKPKPVSVPEPPKPKPVSVPEPPKPKPVSVPEPPKPEPPKPKPVSVVQKPKVIKPMATTKLQRLHGKDTRVGSVPVQSFDKTNVDNPVFTKHVVKHVHAKNKITTGKITRLASVESKTPTAVVKSTPVTGKRKGQKLTKKMELKLRKAK